MGSPQRPPVSFTGPPSADASTFSTSAVAAADGVAPLSLSLTVRDALGNTLSGISVQFASDNPAVAIAPKSGLTDVHGIFSARATSTRTGAFHLSATAAGLAFSSLVQFVPGPPSAVFSRISAAPNPLPSDGAAVAQVSAQFLDSFSRTIPGLLVQFTADAPLQLLNPRNVTDPVGIAAVQVSSTAAGTFSVTASSGGVSMSVPITFRDDLPSQARSSFTLSRSSIPADGHTLSVATLRILDAARRPISGVVFDTLGSFSNLEERVQIAFRDTATDAAGAFQFQAICLSEGTFTLRITAAGLGFAQQLVCTHSGWTRMPQVLNLRGARVSALAFDGARNEIYAATHSGVWHAPFFDFPAHSLFFQALQPDFDAGGRFDATCLAASPGSRAVYACGDGLVQVSNDEAWTWTPSLALPAAPLALATVGDALYAATATGLYLSSDGAQSFALLGAAPRSGLRGLVTGAQGVLAVWTDTGTFFSHDGGLGWTVGGVLPGAVVQVIFDSQAAGRVYASVAANGIFASTDGGAHWTRPANTGLPAASTLDVIAPAPTSQQLFGSTDGFIWFSGDGGANWSRNGGSPGSHALLSIPLTQGFTYASGDDVGITSPVGGEGGLYAQGVKLLAPSGVDVVVADDSGAVQNPFGVLSPFPRVPCPGAEVSRIAAARASGTFLAVCSDGRLLVNTPQSGAWSAVTPAGTGSWVDAFFADSSSLIAIDTAGRAQQSANNGVTWTPFSISLPPILRLSQSPQIQNVFHALAAGGIYASGDGGLTWELKGPNPVGAGSYVFAFKTDGADPASLWIATSTALLHSRDSGASWNPVALPAGGTITDFQSDPSRLDRAWLIQAGVAWITVDAGGAWASRMNGILGSATSIAIPPADPDKPVLGTANDGLFTTTTSGL